MPERALPPSDIAPAEFFERWVPQHVAQDVERQARLGETRATLEFTLTGAGGGKFTVHIDDGQVRGEQGPAREAHLRIELDVDTWRRLNSGELSAPEAFLRRRVHMQGNLGLALKLHVILG